MTTPLPTTLALAAHELAVLPEARGARLECLDGTVWITLHHDRRDIVLEAGDSFVIDRDGDTLVQSTAPALLRVEAAHSRAASRAVAWAVPIWLRRGVQAAVTARWARAIGG